MRGRRLARAPLFLLVLGCALGGFSLTFTHLAGSFGGPGFEDGTGTAARFKSVGAIAADAAGNLYVADTGNHTIRVISPAGETRTLAGVAESFGSANGRGANALFREPQGIYVDASGTVYVADTANHTIRMISSGVVSTLAGSPGFTGLVDDTGTLARFSGPEGITGDPAGNLYVADSFNHAIRMIAPGGVVTTLAGTGSSGNVNDTGTAASFNNPKGIVYDSVSGSLFVADYGNKVIRQITLPGAVVTTFAGTMGSSGHADGTVGIGRMWGPTGIAVDAGSFYVSDSVDSTIRSITSGGTLGTLSGITFYPGPNDGFGGRFNSPAGIAVSSGAAYVADTGNNTVRKISIGDANVSTVAGLAHESGFTNATGGAARFNHPTGLAFYPGPAGVGFAYVSDTDNQVIRRVGVDGVVTTLAGSSFGYVDANGTSAKFRSPRGLALEFATISVYVADTGNHCIRKVTYTGDVTTYAGQGFSSGNDNGNRLTTAKFNSPRGVALSFSGAALYVADTGNRLVRKIDTGTGLVTTLAGSGAYGLTDANGTSASFGEITGIMVDTSDNVYVTESQNGRIRKIEPDGDVTTIAGSGACCTPLDGTGTAARFGYPGPTSIAAGLSGTAFIADPNGQLIRSLVLSSGEVGTAGGKASVTGTSDGTGTLARFNNPTNVASLGGEVVIADGQKIRYGITEIADRATIDSSAGLVGNVRQLDMSPQTATSWQWTIIRRPAGSTATLSSTTIRNPTFTPDVADRYVFRCKATSSSGMSISIVTLNGNDPAASFAVGYPGPFTAGQASGLFVNALDAWGNIADGYTGTAHVTSSDDLATLPGDFAFGPADHGARFLVVTLRRAGLQTITVTDVANPSITGTGSFLVGAAPASVLNISMSSSVASGSSTGATVTAKDPYGNTASSYLGTIHFTSSDGLATLPSNYTFLAGNHGVKTFSGIIMRTGGVQSVTATDTGTASITGSTNITVVPAAPATFTATRSASQIFLSWSASPGADHYDIYRAAAGTYVLLTSVSGTSHLDTTASANTTYAYKVRAVNASGNPSPYSPADAATTLIFTDDPIVTGSTRVKMVHINEVRTAINSLRASAGLSAATFTAGTTIRKTHIDELRTALAAARSTLGLSAISFTDPTLVINTTNVKGVHLTELRSGVK
ncbi:MAG: hypothetical protein ACJ74H_17345 [Thermoanaerobaculia bacterium]